MRSCVDECSVWRRAPWPTFVLPNLQPAPSNGSSSPPAPAKHRHLLPASHHRPLHTHYTPTTHPITSDRAPHKLPINPITHPIPRPWPKKTRASASKRQRSSPKTSHPKPKPSTRRFCHNRPEQVTRRCASSRLRCWDSGSCTEITRGHKTWPT